MDDETPGLKSFQDSKKRVWFPRLNCGVVDAFERRTGAGLFAAVFEAITAQTELAAGKFKRSADAKNPAIELTQKAVLSLAKNILGSVGNVMFLLYEACRPAPGIKPRATFVVEGEIAASDAEVELEDFMAAVGPAEIGDALVCAISVVLAFFPDLGEDEQGRPFAQESQEPASEREPGPGTT